MKVAQIAMIFIYAMDVGYAVANHGKPREGKTNMYVTLFVNALMIFILNQGGFWA